MNPYGTPSNIFQTQADQSANSFSDPLNVAHMYPGWGVNPSLQTPYYDAPYRPQYSGSNPYSTLPRPTFWGGTKQLISPFYRDPYWGNPIDNNRGAFNAIGQKPIDAGAWFGQNIIGPALAFGLANRFTSNAFSNLGRGIGVGAARGMGFGGSSLLARGAQGAAGGIGGFVGGIAGPLALGFAASEFMDATVFQPYLRARQSANTVQNNFAGITFSDTQGGVASGRGLSGREAGRIGSLIDKDALRDMTFSANQYHGIAGMAMNAGLLDDVNSQNIHNKIKSIASQIKLITSISKDPNVQTAIEELAKLRMGGASTTGGALSVAAGAFSAIGMHASAAGMSTQRLMATVGNQGQYMYQMNGLTPYLGQLAAGQTISGFAAAQRQGLLSTAQLARMGGIEGATQSTLAATLAGSQTMYNRMGLINKYIGGIKNGGGVTNTVANFGSLTSRDPMAMLGTMSLYGNQMASNQLESEGPQALENQAIDYLRSIGRTPGPNGFSPGEIAAVLKGVIGLSDDQVQAYASSRASQTNSGVVNQNIKSYVAQAREQSMQVIANNGLYTGAVGRTVRSVRLGWKGTKQAIAGALAYPVAEFAGEMSDAVESGYNNLIFGSTKDDQAAMHMDMYGQAAKTIDLNKMAGGASMRGSNSSTKKAITALKKASTSDGPAGDIARELLAKGFGHKDSTRLFSKFLSMQEDPALRQIYESLASSPKAYDDVVFALQGAIVSQGGETSLEGQLFGMTGKQGGITDSLLILGQAQAAQEILGAPDIGASLEVDSLLNQKEFGALGRNLAGKSAGEKVAKIKEMVEYSLSKGTFRSAYSAAQKGMSVDEVIKNPAAFSKDPTILKALRVAGGDRSAVSRIMQQEIARVSGGLVGDKIRLPGNTSNSELAETMAPQKAAAEAIRKSAENMSSGVDWGSHADAMRTFNDGAKNFAEFAKKLLDAANGSASSTSGASSGKHDPVSVRNNMFNALSGSSQKIFGR